MKTDLTRATDQIKRLLWFVLFALSLALLFKLASCAKLAAASPLDCEAIRDPDQRSYCRALAKNDPSHCRLIRDSDLRHRCLAQVR